jgi:hypothetical protein
MSRLARYSDLASLEDVMNKMNRDCTEFKIKFNKSDYVDSFINALTFDFSDGSVEVFGTSGNIELFFEWHRDERLSVIFSRFSSYYTVWKLLQLEVEVLDGMNVNYTEYECGIGDSM